jgi:hypothetical protein
LRWQKTLARYDGFVFVVAEYNSSITGVLKNALDQAYKEWGRKPFTECRKGVRNSVRILYWLPGAAWGSGGEKKWTARGSPSCSSTASNRRLGLSKAGIQVFELVCQIDNRFPSVRRRRSRRANLICF